MKITVIVCTYNRCESLKDALTSLAVSTLPESRPWEVLVVDNNSNDQTQAVVQDFCRQFPERFRYRFESRPGKSYALNTGIEAAYGKILAFTDDDVTVEPTWLQNLTANLDNPEWMGAGGRTFPKRSFVPPRWLPLEERTLAGLGIFDRGPDPFALKESPLGNNMAYRKEVFEKHGGFRADLGPRPGDRLQNEDTEFGLRLLVAGERLRYEASAVVYHLVPEKRLREDYLLPWWFDKGRADIRATGFEGAASWYVAGIPLVLFRRLAVWTLRWMFSVELSTRFSNKVRVWSLAGQIRECHEQQLSKRRGRAHRQAHEPVISTPQGPARS